MRPIPVIARALNPILFPAHAELIMSWTDHPIIMIDTETTGLFWTSSRVIDWQPWPFG